jgi:hypothetical protein
MLRALELRGPLTQDLFHALTIAGEEQGELCRAALNLNRAKRRGDADEVKMAKSEVREEAVQLISVLCHLVLNLDGLRP